MRRKCFANENISPVAVNDKEVVHNESSNLSVSNPAKKRGRPKQNSFDMARIIDSSVEESRRQTKRSLTDISNVISTKFRNIKPRGLDQEFRAVEHSIQVTPSVEVFMECPTPSSLPAHQTNLGENDGANHTNDDYDNIGNQGVATTSPGNINSTSFVHRKDFALPLCPEYVSLGAPTEECSHCHAIMWNEERTNKNNTRQNPKFSLCCGKGEISLEKVRPTPKYLMDLHNDRDKGLRFKRCIRQYNSMLSFTSMGGNIDYSINKSRGPYVFRLNGVNHHKFGSLIPNTGETPKFCQLYIYDTENEIDNRMRSIDVQDGNLVDAEILHGLLKMLEENNPLVKCFRMARDRFENEVVVDLKIVMKVSRSESGRENHINPSNEVAALIVGDNDYTCGKRDIVIESKTEGRRPSFKTKIKIN